MSSEPIAPAQANKKRTLVSIENGQRFSWQLQPRKCGKGCRTCKEKGGHGPYWYKYRREGKKGARGTYVGKHLPAGIQFIEEEATEEEASTGDNGDQVAVELLSLPTPEALAPEREPTSIANKRNNRRAKRQSPTNARADLPLIPAVALEALAL